MGLHQLESVNMQRNGHLEKSAILLLRKHSVAKHPIMNSPLGSNLSPRSKQDVNGRIEYFFPLNGMFLFIYGFRSIKAVEG